MRKLLVAVFVALLMVGCGESGDVEGVRKSKQLIGGQIFIVTKSRENVKLGLVTVKVFDEDNIEKFREKAKSIFEHRLARVDADIRWDDFKKDWIDSAIAGVTPSAEVKTDADGRFLFTPPSDEFMLTATSSRLTGDEHEEYQWLEVFQRDSIGPSGILLSNDNLLDNFTGSPALPFDAWNRFDTTIGEELRRWKEKLAKIPAEEERKRQEELARERAEEAAAKKRVEEIEQKYGVVIAEAIDAEKLEWRGKVGERLYYAPNQKKPYTGWAKKMWRNEQVRTSEQFKDGKMDGLGTEWYPNGQKKGEGTYKDGKLFTAVAWKPNGDKCPDTNVVNGNGVRVVYNEDGTERRRYIYKHGFLQ